MRIVSLVPSATEMICELGLEPSLVGVTHECDYPPFVRNLPKATRTLIPVDASSAEIDAMVRGRLKTNRALYELDMPVLESLNPDLIVTQTLCDVCAVAEDEVNAAACSLPGRPRVVHLEPTRLRDLFDGLLQIGEAAGCVPQANEAIGRLETRIAAVSERSREVKRRPRVVLLEWIDPLFCCGHWNPEIVRIAGGEEMLGGNGARSRTISWDDVVRSRPEVLFVACCGFDLERTKKDLPTLAQCPGFMEMKCARKGRLYAADGSAYFSRPGPRLVDSLEILAHALHPSIHPLPAGMPEAARWNADA